MNSLHTGARLLREFHTTVLTSSPLLGLAFGALAGGVGLSRLGLIFLCLGGVVSRKGPGWKIAVVLVALLVFWRGSFREIPQFGHRTSHEVTGELVVGRMLTNWSGERVGFFREEGGEEKRVAIQEAEELRPGDVLKIKGSLFRPSAARNPDEFSILSLWKRARVEAGIDLGRQEAVGSSWRTMIWRYAETGRDFLRESVTQGVDFPEAKEIIVAIILGETPASNSEITKAFRQSGAMHVFAVSGLHVTMVGGLIWSLLMLCRVSRRRGIFLVILGTFSYALITGGNPPAMRASLMGATFLSAFFLKRRPSLFNALALSMIVVLLWNPVQVYQVGFQLSFGVISAITLGFAFCYRLFGKIAEIDSLMPQRLLSTPQRFWLNIRGKVAAIMATSLAAWVGSLPWMATKFGLITPVAVLASVLLIPLTFLILALGFLATIVGVVSSSAGGLVNKINASAARSCYLAADGFSNIPYGHYRLDDREPADWVVFDPADGGAASFLATGQGAMIDLGNDRKYRQIVRSALRRWNQKPQTVFITHPDGKHSGAINCFEQDFAPQQTYLPVIWSRSPTFREFVGRENFKKRGIVAVKRRYRYHLSDDVSVRALKEGNEDLDIVGDSRGMALKVTWHGWVVLVMGDLGVEEERDLIESGIDLSADILLLGQHLHTYSGSSEFLRATGVKVVIKSSANYPSFQKPNERWLATCEEFGIEVFNQGETGAVFLDFDEYEVKIRSFLQPKRMFRLMK